MATGNGGLHFEPTMDIGQIRQSSKEVKKEITDATRAIEGMGTAFDLMTDITKKDIKDQKQYISGLEKEYAKLENRIKSMPRGSARDALQGKANTLRHEIESEKEALNAMEIAVERNSKAHQSFRTQLRQVNQEMMELAANGQKDTDAYRALQAKAVELQKNMREVGKELSLLSGPGTGFQVVASGLSAVTGTMAAANGVMALFGSKSKNLNEIMTRMQSLMAITIGLQQVSTTVSKQGAVMIGIEAMQRAAAAKAAQMQAKGTVAATIAQKAFNVVAKANPYVLLATALITVVGALYAFSKGAKKASDEMKKFNESLNESIAESASKSVEQVTRLSNAWNKLGDDMKAKQRFIEENTESFKQLGVNVRTVEEAENLLVKNKDAFVRSQMEKAKAVAAASMAQEIMAKKLKAELELEKKPEKVRVVDRGEVNEITGEYSEDAVSYETNKDYKRLKEEIQGYEDDLKKLYGIVADSEAAAVKELEDAGIKAWNEYEEGMVGAIKQAIAEKQKALEYVSSKEEYDKIVGEIADLQKQLEKITGGSGNTTNKGAFDIIEVVEKLDQKLEELRVLKEKVRNTGIVDQDELENLESEIEKLEKLVDKFKQLRDPGLVPKLEPIKPKELVVEPNEVKIDPKEVEIMPQSISRWKFVWQDIENYFKELDYAEVAGNFGEIASKIKDIGDAAGDADLNDFAEGLEEVASLAGTVIQGFAQGGWVGALVNAIMWVGSSLLEMAAEDAAVGEAIENSYLATALQKINEMMQSFSDSDKWGAFFGDDSLADFESALSALIAIRENIDYLNRSSDMGDFATMKKYPDQVHSANIDPSERMMTYNDKSTFWNWFGIEDQEASLTKLAEMMGYSADELYKDGKYNVDILQQILDTYPKMAEEDREWIEAAIDLTNEYNEALEQMADYMRSLFGEVADTIADQMIDSFLESGQAAIEFGAVVSDVAKKMAKDLIKNLMYTTIFKSLEDDIMGVINLSNGMNEESAPIILGMMQSALTKLQGQMPFYQELLEILSPFFDGSVAEETTAASGNLLQSASQDSVSLLNGQLNAMRAYQGRMEDMMTQVLWSLAGIRDDMNSGFGETVRHLEAIDNNTSENGSILHQLGIWLG